MPTLKCHRRVVARQWLDASIRKTYNMEVSGGSIDIHLPMEE